MYGAQKTLLLIVVGLGLLCAAIIVGFLVIALWAEREAVGIGVVVVIGLVIAVYLRGKLNEQDIRRMRYRHHEETPLDAQGEPLYWQAGVQPNPHRRAAASAEQWQGMHLPQAAKRS